MSYFFQALVHLHYRHFASWSSIVIALKAYHLALPSPVTFLKLQRIWNGTCAARNDCLLYVWLTNGTVLSYSKRSERSMYCSVNVCSYTWTTTEIKGDNGFAAIEGDKIRKFLPTAQGMLRKWYLVDQPIINHWVTDTLQQLEHHTPTPLMLITWTATSSQSKAMFSFLCFWNSDPHIILLNYLHSVNSCAINLYYMRFLF